ncbi:anti-sigma factor [Demequina globuliformis]|uniref:anti-sigma factor n=1 Tax=Demequina globuliformis TaxID=676202 RepID=UPI00078229ED|nr:anti-sigma factor [Demequina globuliformis]
MSHLNDDALAALALGDGSEADAAHTTQCAVCAEALAEYTRITGALGGLDGRVTLETPPASVWESIAQQTAPAAAVDTSVQDGAAGDTGRHAGREATRDTASASGAGAPSAAARTVAPADELAARRERRTGPSWWSLVGAAAAGVVIGGVGVSMATTGTDRNADVVASAPLSQLQTESSAGTADLQVRDDGTQVLVVETDYEPQSDAYLEVWLIDEDIDGMVSLGHLTGDRTEFTLPEGFDVTMFPIVDISIEPTDGVPTHSGDSITRGKIDI